MHAAYIQKESFSLTEALEALELIVEDERGAKAEAMVE